MISSFPEWKAAGKRQAWSIPSIGIVEDFVEELWYKDEVAWSGPSHPGTQDEPIILANFTYLWGLLP